MDRSGAPPRRVVGEWSWLEAWPFGMRWVVANAFVALGIAGVGLAIDYGIGSWDRPLAASILKYYWFRWNDVAWPLGIAAALVGMASAVGNGNRRRREAAWGALAVLLGVGSLLIGVRFWEHTQAWGAFGDRARLLSKWDDEATQREQLRDWLAVCAWIRENTPADGLWLTPKNQQSFKWHAQRAELACNKDMPQDAVSVLEWSARLEAAYPVTEEKISIPWTDEKLWELQQRYGLRFVLLDHRVPGQGPPLLPILYPPPGVRNDNFSVYEFPSSPVRLSPPRER
jgi:hypothetical protein